MSETTTQRTLRMLQEEWTRPYREALLELHSAGLALVPHLPPISAKVVVRWDEAMGAADALLTSDGRSEDAAGGVRFPNHVPDSPA